jgi:hypothetical protein
MKDSFIIEGKKYISSRRASEISDYASDYVGQLCRAGKLDCKMIGRSWFVSEESLHLHKATISREEALRSRIENLKGPKIQVAQNSFVSTQNIDKSKIASEQVTPVSLAPASNPIVASTTVAKTSNEQTNVISTIPWQIVDVSSAGIKSPYVYSSDERPLLPVLNKKDVEIKEESKIEIKKAEEVVHPVVGVVKNNFEIVSQKATKIFVKSSETKLQPVVSDSKIVSEAKKNVFIKAVAPVKVSKITRKVVSYPELTRSIILKRVIAPAFVIVMFFGIGTGVYITADKVSNSIGTEIASGANMVTANISDAFNSAYASLRNGYKSVVAFFTSPAKVAMEVPKEFGNVTVSDVTPNGIVLSSSTGSETGDEALKQKIAGSFSDEVEVNPDSSGTAGVITQSSKIRKEKILFM